MPVVSAINGQRGHPRSSWTDEAGGNDERTRISVDGADRGEADDKACCGPSDRAEPNYLSVEHPPPLAAVTTPTSNLIMLQREQTVHHACRQVWTACRSNGNDLDELVKGVEVIRVAGVERKTGRARCRRDEQIDGSRSSGLSTGPDDSRIDAEQLAWRWLLDASDQSHEYAARLRHRCRMSGRDATCSAECCS